MMMAGAHHILPPKFPPTTRQSPLPRNLPRPASASASASTSPTAALTAPAPLVSAATIQDDDRTAAFWDYQFLFVSQRKETTEPILLRVVDGAIPVDFPSGRYYLIGPGLFRDDHGSTVHPLDGHGYLRAFEFDGEDKGVRFMAKYVRTEAQLEEHDPVRDQWRFSYRGPFSVLKAGKKLGNVKVMKNVANTTVVKWGNKLLCLWEGGDPYEIDPLTLDTVGKFEVINSRDTMAFPGHSPRVSNPLDLAAAMLKPILFGVFKMPARRMLSHYKMDAEKQRLLVLSCNAEDMLLPRSHFTFYEYDSSFHLIQKKEYVVPDHLMIHDWAFTDSHYIMFGNRIRLDVLGSMGAVLGLSPMISALSVNPGKPTSPVYLLPRSSSHDEGTAHRDWRQPIELPSQLWLLHFGNAFQREGSSRDGVEIKFLATAASYRWLDFPSLFGYDWRSGKLDPTTMNETRGEQGHLPHLVQASISIDSEGCCSECYVEPLNKFTKVADFPVINPEYSGRKNRYIYAATSSGSHQGLPHFPFDSVVKLDISEGTTHVWSTSRRRFIGEPVFVPRGRSREDDGYIILVEYAVEIQRCYLVILDAQKIGGGEGDELMTRLEVPKHFNFPFGFHGFWDSTTTTTC
ncbi:hypothetical protein MLD38_012243 [Melastoma candidum]|uniref:Uncharacterized protein n=1 Tax=Melastoma candidum TaxID=119954 RepID=A0ACB9R6T2_9MYRT|nr:hypothetical protein MLD38_012243 [Melastoma candidum]